MQKEQQGFLTIAQNTESVDYLRLAYAQAMSIKLVMPDSKYAVLVDEGTYKQVTEKYKKVFDYVIKIENDLAKNETWKLSNEWQVFNLSPFKETIKLESDILFTRSIKHWWNSFRFKDIVLSTGCKNFLQEAVTSREYRKLFDDNELPDVYSGLMYFRFSQPAKQFFSTAGTIYKNWEHISTTLLKNCRDTQPTTDVVYALAAKIIGVEDVTLPTMDFINFVHMKPAINDWPRTKWNKLVMTETELPMIRVANVNQYHPLHYHEKEWLTDEIIKEYEYAVGL